MGAQPCPCSWARIGTASHPRWHPNRALRKVGSACPSLVPHRALYSGTWLRVCLWVWLPSSTVNFLRKLIQRWVLFSVSGTKHNA